MKTNSLYIVCLGIFLIACKSQQYTAETLPANQLAFGEGGGFSGAITEFILLENGQLFVKNSLTNKVEELPPVKKKQVQALRTEAEVLNMSNLNINSPGNIYYFIRYQQADTIQQAIWGDPNYTLDPKVQNLYQRLKAFTIKTK